MDGRMPHQEELKQLDLISFLRQILSLSHHQRRESSEHEEMKGFRTHTNWIFRINSATLAPSLLSLALLFIRKLELIAAHLYYLLFTLAHK